MRFLLDVCFPDLVARQLEADGHTCTFMRRIDARASDDAILAAALRDNQVILTRDWDYGELVMRRSLPTAGVVIFAAEPEDVIQKAEQVLEVVRRFGEGLRDHLTVVGPSKIRRRRPPRLYARPIA